MHLNTYFVDWHFLFLAVGFSLVKRVVNVCSEMQIHNPGSVNKDVIQASLKSCELDSQHKISMDIDAELVFYLI